MKQAIKFVKDTLISKEREDAHEVIDEIKDDEGNLITTYKVTAGNTYRVEILEADLEKALNIAYMEGQCASEKDFAINGKEGTNTLTVTHTPTGVQSIKTARTYITARNEAIYDIIGQFIEA